jgi:membrane protein DedA with SNARE-associated domain
MSSFIQHYGYFGLFLLSVLSSACIPIPSEVAYGFAGAACTSAITGHAQFSIWAVIVDRWGKWLLLTHDDLEKSERWFEKYGTVSVLVSRLIPVVRSFISVPAGIAEMKRGLFDLLTAIGSAVWVALLAGLGYAAGKNWNHVSKDFHAAELPIIILVVLLIVAAFWHRVRTVRRYNASKA